MEWLSTLFLYLHVAGVIVAFGPDDRLPVHRGQGGEVSRCTATSHCASAEMITEKVVEPGAVFVFLMGVGLIVTKGYNPLDQLWVGVSIVLFLITLAFANLVQLRTIRKMVAPDRSAAASRRGGTAARVRRAVVQCGARRHLHDGDALHHPRADDRQAVLSKGLSPLAVRTPGSLTSTRRTRPGRAPVCSPASMTTSPPTTTHSIPVGNCLGWS